MIDIAIVGIGCRFPGGVSGPEEFWDFLQHKGDGIREVPEDRWSLERFYDPDPDAPGRMYVRQGGFLTQSLWDFDPEYFGISPREASIMDPQQRLVLEVAVEALDDAGLGPKVGGRDVGVYIGGFTSDNMAARHTRDSRGSINSHTATSGTFTMLSNRLSYVLDLTGPSMTIDTACSSSLVAVHEAAQAVARGECEAAMAGGVNAMIRPETFVAMCKGRFLAPDGRCKTFDATADGYARGEGAGVVVLKPLAAARADGDRIYSVIRATGSNQDGRTSGITVPNPVSQAKLAARVLSESGLEAGDIGYVEAHGTGTSIGDPLELQALGQTYGDVPGRHTPLVVGSVKASIGHLEAAAGVASVIKAALTVHHGEISPQAWLHELNPAIPFDDYRVEIPTEVRPFPDGYAARAVAVNGFGYGGTNAHVVMSEDQPFEPVDATPAAYASDLAAGLLPVSGRNDGAVRDQAAAYAEALRAVDPAEVAGLIAAAWTRRTHHPTRVAVAGPGAGVDTVDRDGLVAELERVAAGEGRSPGRVVAGAGEPGQETRPVFVFSGMGPQWWRMGRDLLAREGAFAAKAREIDERFVALTGWSIITELLRDEDDSRVSRTEVAQPANFLVQVALAAELAALGVVPEAVVGHSVGEVSAAYVSGALSLDDALLVSYHRSRLQATTAGSGKMLAVGLPEADVLGWLPADGRISVAAVNSPSSVTLAGETPVLEELAERLTAEGVFARALRVEVPYHSHLMDPILDDIREALAPLSPREPELPLHSSVTAEAVTGADWGPDYWVDNVREPVRFAAAVSDLVAAGHRVFLEVGPHPVLGGNIREVLVRSGETGVVVPTLNREQPDAQSVRQAVAELYVAGALPTDRVPGTEPGPVRQVVLPPYAWQRTRMWSEVDAMAEDRLGRPDAPAMIGMRSDSVNPQWEVELSESALPWLPDHVVDGLVVLPGAAYLDMALSAAAEVGRHESQSLEGVRFDAARIIDAADVPVLRLGLQPGTGRFSIESRPGAESVWSPHVSGRIVDGSHRPGSHELVPDAHAEHVLGSDLYARLDEIGLSYGPQFRGIVEAWVGPDALVAHVDASASAGSRHLAHPATVDAALQCVAALVTEPGDAASGPVVPFAMAAVRRFAPLPEQVTVSVRRLDRPGLHADIALADRSGQVVLEMLGVEFRPVRPPASAEAEIDPLWLEMVFERTGAPSVRPDLSGSLVVAALRGRIPARARELVEAHPRGRLVEIDPARAGDATTQDPLGRALAEERAASERVTLAYVPPTISGDPRGGGPDIMGGMLVVAATAQAQVDEQPGGDDGTLPGRVFAVAVTESAFSVPGDVEETQLAHAGLIGLRRTLRNEQPDLSWRLVDTEAATPPLEVLAEVLVEGEPAAADDGAILRPGARLGVTLQPTLAQHLSAQATSAPMTDPEASYVVEASASMLMKDLALREVARREPGAGQIEVRLLSAGVNYKDAAKVIGLLTERELRGTFFGTGLGMESIATVVRTGPGVEEYTVGDRVALGARASLARYATVDIAGPDAVKPAPSVWGDHDSALLLPFLTAHHALADTARVQPGETVLVHGAAGGVGLAAIQVAHHLGARVIGTASSPERREAVLAAGADAALDSRSLSFVAEVHQLTDGAGVDVVISSAPGEVIGANLDVAAEFGRIVEVGKSDIYGRSHLPLEQFDRNLTFAAIDIDRLFALRRPVVMTLLDTIFELFEQGVYTALPVTVYPVSELAAAFDAVIRGSNTGRVVLDFTEAAPPVRPLVPEARIEADASYLVTGGFGDFGLATAQWLVRRGARHLVLAGRRGASTVEAKLAVAALVEAGVDVREAHVDVADADAVAELVRQVQSGPAPLRGVFHAAGVLDDRPVAEVDLTSLTSVLLPKARGAYNLHRATLDQGVELDHFVTYSSASAITGNVPQSSYAAANTVLDSLVAERRRLGLPGLTVNWGVLSGGMASSSQEVAQYLSTIGLGTIDMGTALKGMEQALALDVAQLGVIDIDWARWGATHPHSAGTLRFADHVAAAGAADSDAAALQSELLALPEPQRVEVVAYMMSEQLAVVLGIPADSIDLDVALPDLGMDSLMAVELQARINLAMGIEVSALEFGRGGGLSALATRLMPQLTGTTEAV